MRRIRSKETVLLVLPCVALLGFGVLLPSLQAKPKSTLRLTGVTVTRVTKSQRNDPDVKVHAQFNSNQSFQERYLRPSWSLTLTDAYILGGVGKKHYMISGTPLEQRTIAPSRWSRDFADYPLCLGFFPKSAGKLTFHFTAVTQDGFKLPASVVVRS